MWGGRGAGTAGFPLPHHVRAPHFTPPLQGTKVEGVINKPFEGHTHMIIQCLNVDSKSSLKESFMDLQV